MDVFYKPDDRSYHFFVNTLEFFGETFQEGGVVSSLRMAGTDGRYLGPSVALLKSGGEGIEHEYGVTVDVKPKNQTRLEKISKLEFRFDPGVEESFWCWEEYTDTPTHVSRRLQVGMVHFYNVDRLKIPDNAPTIWPKTKESYNEYRPFIEGFGTIVTEPTDPEVLEWIIELGNREIENRSC